MSSAGRRMTLMVHLELRVDRAGEQLLAPPASTPITQPAAMTRSPYRLVPTPRRLPSTSSSHAPAPSEARGGDDGSLLDDLRDGWPASAGESRSRSAAWSSGRASRWSPGPRCRSSSSPRSSSRTRSRTGGASRRRVRGLSLNRPRLRPAHGCHEGARREHVGAEPQRLDPARAHRRRPQREAVDPARHHRRHPGVRAEQDQRGLRDRRRVAYPPWTRSSSTSASTSTTSSSSTSTTSPTSSTRWGASTAGCVRCRARSSTGL